MTSWSTYPSIHNLGHRAIADLLNEDCLVEEKVDGSQFSFGVFEVQEGDGLDLRIRSKGAVMNIDAPEKMFTKATETVKSLQHKLTLGWTYRGEYLAKPKHNTLAYDRVPQGNIILFDINTGLETYLSHEEKLLEAARLGLECVPLLYQGRIKDIQAFRQFLMHNSVLGGQKIEGVVVKPVGYNLWGKDKKCLMGKFVSEAFKEVHAHAWRSSNPTQGDILSILQADYGTQTRWQKAVQHLRESGKIEDDPRDIGLLMREVPIDIERECEEEIKKRLFEWAWPLLRRMVTRGLPEWYKDSLLKLQFEHSIPESTGIPPE